MARTPRTLLPALADVASLLRLHIVGIAVSAALVFSWLMTGHVDGVALAACAIDWLVINLLNRITEIDEDLGNGTPATGLVARHPRALGVGTAAGLLASLAVTHWLAPGLTLWRMGVQLVGTTSSMASWGSRPPPTSAARCCCSIGWAIKRGCGRACRRT